jgi:DNA-directed RNA polymerase subunit RPC12/RpoP
MKFPFNCTECGHVNHAVWSQVGQQIDCDRCGKPLTVPAPMESIAEPAQAPLRLTFRCPSCRRKFSTKPELAGQKIRCTRCGAGVRVPLLEQASDASASQPVLASLEPSDEIAVAPVTPRRDPVSADVPRIDVGRPAKVKPANVEAPSALSSEIEALADLDGSGRRRKVESVLSSRAELLETARLREAEERAVDTQMPLPKDPTKKKKKKRKKTSSYFDPKETLQLVAGVGALVAVLAFLAWRYPDFRLPLGGVLCVIGFIVYVLGAISLRQLVAEEGFIKLMLFRFFPPYQWWFIVSRWQETRDFFAFFLAGAIVMSVGGAIIKTSPLSLKAEADERAYQKKVERRQAELRLPEPFGRVEADDD